MKGRTPQKLGIGLTVVLTVAGLGVTGSGAWAVNTYDITDLGTLPDGTESMGNGLNKNGVVVGSATTTGMYNPHAFRYSGTTMQDLGTLGGESTAWGINDNGVSVGWSYTGTGSSGYARAFRFSGSAMESLGTLGGLESYAYDINNAGEIVGNAFDGRNFAHAFLYSGGTMSDLGTLDGTRSGANGINDSGVVTGYVQYDNGLRHAFIYADAVMQNLGTLGGRWSEANAVNNNGVVVGQSESYWGSMETHAFVWDVTYTGGTGLGGHMRDLGSGLAEGINDSGQVVGKSDVNDGAFLYRDGSMLDLNALIDPGSGWWLTRAYDINNSGQIVGYGNHNGVLRGFLLTPSEDPPETTPELSSASLLLVGMLPLGLAWWRRRRAA